MKKTFLCLILAVSVLVLASCLPEKETKHSFAIYNHRTNDYSVGIFDESEETLLKEYELFSGESIVIKLDPGRYVLKYEGRNEGTGYPYPGIDVDLTYGDFHICLNMLPLGYTEGGGKECCGH